MSEDPFRAIGEVVTRLEFEARCRRDIDTRFSGTTLAMIVIQETRVISVNIGDSRIVLGTRNNEGQLVAYPLSTDHKPDDFEELHRIIHSGGRVYRTSSPLPLTSNTISKNTRMARVLLEISGNGNLVRKIVVDKIQ
jgi:serine/threonine protein phosphatase PrpC